MDDIVESEGASSPKMEIVFTNIGVTKGGQTILHNISGVARPGQLLAVMGASGSGKTTLLDTLAGREPHQSGQVKVNGVVMNKAMKRKLSYVLQQDVFFPNLTLRETLSFTAMLRLPDEMSKKEKMKRLDQIIDELDIRKCLDTILGDVWCRGLSGGEKKRASIACELITDPAVIFMDEPTSGLDYSTAFSLVRTMRTITELHQKTVVMTIHQPSSQMFFTFHNLLLLCEGQLAYFGPCANVIDFFSEAGHTMTAHYNPADFIIEKLGEGKNVQEDIINVAKRLRKADTSPNALLRMENGVDSEENASLKSMNGKSSDKPSKESIRDVKEDADDIHVSLMELTEEGTWQYEDFESERKWPSGWVTQYTQLTMRTFRESRTRILSKLKIMESVVLCLLVSLVWFQLPRIEETLRDRMGAIFFTIIHWGFTPLFDAVSSFPMERVVIHKERSAGWYRLSAYYLAKMTSELPLILLQPAIFVVVSYWCIGLNGVGPFFGTVMVVMINAIAGQSIGLFLGIACMDFRRAMTVATIIMMAIMLLGGFYTRNLPFWLDWIKYLSFLHYSFHSAMVLEFSDAAPVMCAASANASQFSKCLQPNVTSVSSEDVLSFYHMELPFWQYFLPLFVFIVIFRLAGYLTLRFVYHPQSG